MSDEYIRKDDAISIIEKEMKHYVSDIWYKSATHSALNDVNEDIKSLEPADVVPVEILKTEIYKLKCQQDSKNQDYYTGYMSALSTVEGILAEMGEG